MALSRRCVTTVPHRVKGVISPASRRNADASTVILWFATTRVAGLKVTGDAEQEDFGVPGDKRRDRRDHHHRI